MRVAIIPARGGSVRIPRKNIRHFFGKPIIEYSIDTAKRSQLFDRVVVSTDDAAIGAIARAAGAEVLMRGPGLEDVGTQRIGEDVLERLADDGPIAAHACVIYATCPLMLPEDLKAGWDALLERRALFAFAVGSEPLRDAGMFYWGEGWAFAARKHLVSPRSAMVPIPEDRVCDINVEADWARAETMYAARKAIACTAS